MRLYTHLYWFPKKERYRRGNAALTCDFTMFTCRNKCKRMRKPSVSESLFSILRVGAWCACLCVCFWALRFWALGFALCSLPFEFYVLRLLFVCVLRFVLKFTFSFSFSFSFVFEFAAVLSAL